MPRVVAVPSINRDSECGINLSLLFAINGDGSICNKKWNWDLGGAAVRYDRYISDLAEMQARIFYLISDTVKLRGVLQSPITPKPLMAAIQRR